MAQKERYYIKCDMIIDEEKIINSEQDVTICDIDDSDILVNLLNRQDKEIKKLKQQLTNALKEYQEYREVVTEDIEKEVDERMRDTIKEFHLDIEQLKQSQKQLAIEELEKALVLIQNAVNLESPEYDLVGLYDAIVDQIKSLKGEE